MWLGPGGVGRVPCGGWFVPWLGGSLGGLLRRVFLSSGAFGGWGLGDVGGFRLLWCSFLGVFGFVVVLGVYEGRIRVRGSLVGWVGLFCGFPEFSEFLGGFVCEFGDFGGGVGEGGVDGVVGCVEAVV